MHQKLRKIHKMFLGFSVGLSINSITFLVSCFFDTVSHTILKKLLGQKMKDEKFVFSGETEYV
jgi:hypothetical protein